MGHTIHNKELGAEIVICSAMVDKASDAAALGGVNAAATEHRRVKRIDERMRSSK